MVTAERQWQPGHGANTGRVAEVRSAKDSPGIGVPQYTHGTDVSRDAGAAMGCAAFAEVIAAREHKVRTGPGALCPMWHGCTAPA
jgi:hypothetical protein